MSKRIWIGLLVSCLGLAAFSQDIVQLKDGSEVTGKVIANIVGEELRLRTADGSVISYPSADVERVMLDKRHHPFEIKTEGYYNHSSVNITIGSSFASALGTSMYMVNGWQWNSHWMTGIGIGKEWIRFQRLMPIMADVRYNLRPARKGTPYLHATAGYTVALGDTYYDNFAADWWTKPFGKTYGGIGAGLQIGYRSYWGRHLGYTLSTGVRYQHLKGVYPDVFWQGQQIKYASNERMNWLLAQVGVGLLFR